MFRAFQEKREEAGFTLIELLVVILIIAILAAIAIPVFLNQRKKGWIGQSESALKNAATAVESCSTGNNGSYDASDGGTKVCASTTEIANEGYRDVSGVTLSFANVTSSAYCILANHANDINNYKYESSAGKPVDTGSESGTC